MAKKYYDCIHCGMKPFPICPECDGYWSGGFHEGSASCNVCGYKPTSDELGIIVNTSKIYNEQEKLKKELGAEPTPLEKDAQLLYNKLHSHLIDSLATADGSSVLNLVQALSLAKKELEKGAK